jgi:hypothetical protein
VARPAEIMSSGQTEAESRLSIHEVPEQISRIFFGKPDNQPSYGFSDSYGAPQGTPVNYNPGYGAPAQASVPYANFFSDMELAMKLGQVALIAFIILVVVVVAFLLLLCCMYCPSMVGGRNRNDQDFQPMPYYPSHITNMDTNEKSQPIATSTNEGGGSEWQHPITPNSESSSTSAATSPRARTPSGNRRLKRHQSGTLSPHHMDR